MRQSSQWNWQATHGQIAVFSEWTNWSFGKWKFRTVFFKKKFLRLSTFRIYSTLTFSYGNWKMSHDVNAEHKKVIENLNSSQHQYVPCAGIWLYFDFREIHFMLTSFVSGMFPRQNFICFSLIRTNERHFHWVIKIFGWWVNRKIIDEIMFTTDSVQSSYSSSSFYICVSYDGCVFTTNRKTLQNFLLCVNAIDFRKE